LLLLNTFSSIVDYSYVSEITKYGMCGIKVWLLKIPFYKKSIRKYDTFKLERRKRYKLFFLTRRLFKKLFLFKFVKREDVYCSTLFRKIANLANLNFKSIDPISLNSVLRNKEFLRKLVYRGRRHRHIVKLMFLSYRRFVYYKHQFKLINYFLRLILRIVAKKNKRPYKFFFLKKLKLVF
jgi:hypothetical protein